MPRTHCSSAPGGELGGADVRTQNLLLNEVLSQEIHLQSTWHNDGLVTSSGKGFIFYKSSYRAFSKDKTRTSGTGSFVFCLFLMALCTE